MLYNVLSLFILVKIRNLLFVCLFVLFFAQSNALMHDILPQRNIPNADSAREAISQAVLVNHSREDWGISETPRVGKPWDVCDP